MSEAAPVLYTIGHSNQDLDAFLALLRANAIEVLVDVRSSPYTAYAIHFNAEPLKAAVTSAGMRYVYMGDSIGGRPEGAQFYDEQGYVLYDRVAESGRFREGIDKLMRGLQGRRVAVMCSEEDPTECHRHLLIARVLTERGVQVLHIHAGGSASIQTEADILAAEEAERNPGGQGTLFDLEEPQEWRSTRSVSPRGKPPSSSSR